LGNQEIGVASEFSPAKSRIAFEFSFPEVCIATELSPVKVSISDELCFF
jgi:hypothetical protein